jgi:hypothetical protein
MRGFGKSLHWKGFFYDYVLFGMVRLARLLIHKRSRKGAFIDASRNAFYI